jgi:hypothetical protein
MPPRILCSVALLGLPLFLPTGCANVATLEPTSRYVAPGANDGIAGFVKGTQTWGLLGSGPTAFVYAVEGKRVPNEFEKWNELLPVKAGRVDLEIGVQSGALRRTVHLDCKIAAGELYEIRFQVSADASAPAKKFCDIWIASLSSDIAVTPLERVSLSP